MKTTIDIDVDRVRRLKQWTGLKSCKAVVAYALQEAERMARLQALFRRALPSAAFKDALDPAYDLAAWRRRETIRTSVACRG